MDTRRPSLVRRWWLPITALALGLVLIAAKLSVRSVATGEAVLPGVAGAPMLGPGPTATATPNAPRGRVRIEVLDQAGAPVSLALVEIRDRFNSIAATSETGQSGEVILMVPSGPGYVASVRREGFGLSRSSAFAVDRPPPTPPSGTPPRVPSQTVQLRLEPAAQIGAPALARLFVGHTQTPRLSLIDPISSLLLKHSEPLGQGRLTVQAPSRDATRVYATWAGGADLFVLSGADLTVEKHVPLNVGAISSIAVNPRDGRLWVSTYQPDTTDTGFLLEFDVTSWDVLRRVNMGQITAGLRFKPDGSMLYARHRSTNALSFVDPAAGAVTRVARLPQWPTDMSVSPDGTRLYLVFLGSERLVELDAVTGEPGRVVEIGSGAAGVIAHPDGRRVFVINQLLGSVQVVDLAGGLVTDLIPVGRAPQGAALAGTGLYVANSGSGSVSVIDVAKNTIRETLQTGGTPSTLMLVERM
ncbi:MAG: YncE family protein [Chloroflexota bacterium]